MFPLSSAQIAKVLGSPLMNVATYWPLLEACMDSLGLSTDRVKIAALATIGVEAPHFCAQDELGGDRYYLKMYDVSFNPDKARELGNSEVGDGPRFHGRGILQLTGRRNYDYYGKQIGVDLVAHPEEANAPAAACAIFATYFRLHHDLEAAEAADWRRVRKTVNGGLNGLDLFLRLVHQFEAAVNANASVQTPAQTQAQGASSNG